ncbi:MAG TPA: CBS domain-containing protein [Pirellulaceae bacterium]|nr:CBS domain-containing protein [Pirellulaceae bacterium]HMO93379.1 CBS domain-containing protein [Pirellulaceae bacterium]HMP70439.1 CBS domain-containing protein [Pirellulaceae bacterium]
MTTKIVKVRDVMKRQFDLVDGKLTVKEALLGMKHPETRSLVINKRDEGDEYGLVLIADIAKHVLAVDRSPERVNLYEIMSKPVLSVSPEMNIKYCARLLDRYNIMRAPVVENNNVVGIVSFHDLVLTGLLELLT